MHVISWLSAFLHNNRGGVAVVFALSALPIMALIGLAVDYAAVTRGRHEARSFADAAVLASISEAASIQDQTDAVAVPRAKAMAESQFRALMVTRERDWRLASVEVAALPVNNSIEVTLCFNALKRTIAMGLMGIGSIPFSACATATSAPPVYVKVFALIDASGSMGIGASKADQDMMRSKLGCEFACHTLTPHPAHNGWANCTFSNWWNQRTECVKFIGAKTRFDVIRGSMIKVAEQAQILSRIPGQYELNVYKFSNYLTTVFDNRSSALGAAKSALERMEQDREGGGTNMRYVFPQLANLLPQNGDGRTRDTAKVFVLILSDGIEDNVFEKQDCYFNPRNPCGTYYGNWIPDQNFLPYRSWHSPEVMNSALCDVFKRKGATVMSLYTTNLRNGVEWNPGIRTNMQRCASQSDFGFSANSGEEVDKAVRQMFSAVVSKARLTR